MNLRDKSFTVSHYIKDVGWRKACAAQRVLLKDVEFKVSEKGRQRTIAKKQRNVHAYAYGTLASWVDSPLVGGTQVSYNPYKDYTFVTEHNASIYNAMEVLFSMKHGVQAWGIVS